jgi:hypothetical protein
VAECRSTDRHVITVTSVLISHHLKGQPKLAITLYQKSNVKCRQSQALIRKYQHGRSVVT